MTTDTARTRADAAWAKLSYTQQGNIHSSEAWKSSHMAGAAAQRTADIELVEALQGRRHDDRWRALEEVTVALKAQQETDR